MRRFDEFLEVIVGSKSRINLQFSQLSIAWLPYLAHMFMVDHSLGIEEIVLLNGENGRGIDGRHTDLNSSINYRIITLENK